MASTSVKDRFTDKHYINWLKCGHGLNCVAEGLTPFCKTVADELHKKLVCKLGNKQCSAGCTTKRIVKKLGPNGKKSWTIRCRDNICNKWVDSIVPLIATSQFTWNNSIVSEWPVESWQLAKIFMGSGQDPSNVDPSQTGALGLVQLLINCKEFHFRIDTEKAVAVSFSKQNRYFMLLGPFTMILSTRRRPLHIRKKRTRWRVKARVLI